MTIQEIRTKALGLMDAIDTDLVNSGIDSNTLNVIGQLRILVESLPGEPALDISRTIDTTKEEEDLLKVFPKKKATVIPIEPNKDAELSQKEQDALLDAVGYTEPVEPEPEPSKDLDEVVNILIPVAVNYLVDPSLNDIPTEDFDKLLCNLQDNFKRILTESGLVMPVDVKCSECGNTELRYTDGDWYMKDEPPREDNVFCRKCSIEHELTFVPTAIEVKK